MSNEQHGMEILHMARWLGRLCIVLVLADALGAQTASASLGRFATGRDDGQTRRLPPILREISGLAVTADGRLLGHDDEIGVIYELDPYRGAILKSFRFGNELVRGDFEGIAIAGDELYVTTSDGTIYATAEGANGARMRYRVQETRLGRRCEIEGLAFEPRGRVLLLPCKRVRDEALEDSVVIFRWSLDEQRLAEPSKITLPLSRVLARMRAGRFRPSAIELLPETGTYFVLSARDAAIIEISRAGDLLAVRELSEDQHPQAEGLTFTRDRMLVIADEGNPRGSVTVYRRPEH